MRWRAFPATTTWPGRERLRSGGDGGVGHSPAAPGLLHRHQRVHRLQGLRGGVQGVEQRPRGRPRLAGPVLRQHGGTEREHLAARRLHRAAEGRTGRPLAHELRRLQALHLGSLPRGLPHRVADPDRVRDRGRAAGHLQRLRLLRPCLPLRRHRPPRGGRPGLEMHPLLRPPQGRPATGLRQGMPHRVHPVRPPARVAPAGGAASRDPAGAR